MFKKLLIFLLFIFVSYSLFSLTSDEIVQKVDAIETFEHTYAEGTIISQDRFGQKKSTFKSWSEGEYNSLIEFTSAAEKGQKILRTKNDLYLFYPDAETIIRLHGSALRQTVLGSDISYEDLSSISDTLNNYTTELLKEEVIEQRECYVIALDSKSKNVAYPKQTIWVDKNSFMVVKRELYTKANRLLKEIVVKQSMVVAQREIPKVTLLIDKLKKDSLTEMYLDFIDVDITLDKNFFSLQNLRW